MRFAPPYAPGSAAGPRWYTVRVSSGVHPGVGGTVEGNLAVGAFHDLGAELVPRETRGRWRRTTHAVRLTNGGNVLEQVELDAVDDDETLAFVLPPEETTLAPGAVTTVDLRVSAPRRWIGRPRPHPFHVTASPRGPLEPHRLDGSRVAVPLLSRWMGLAAVVALLAAAAAISVPRSWRRPSPHRRSSHLLRRRRRRRRCPPPSLRLTPGELKPAPPPAAPAPAKAPAKPSEAPSATPEPKKAPAPAPAPAPAAPPATVAPTSPSAPPTTTAAPPPVVAPPVVPPTTTHDHHPAAATRLRRSSSRKARWR